MVLKGGETIVDGGEIRATPAGRTLANAPAFDAERLPAVREWFEEHYSHALRELRRVRPRQAGGFR